MKPTRLSASRTPDAYADQPSWISWVFLPDDWVRNDGWAKYSWHHRYTKFIRLEASAGMREWRVTATAAVEGRTRFGKLLVWLGWYPSELRLVSRSYEHPDLAFDDVLGRMDNWFGHRPVTLAYPGKHLQRARNFARLFRGEP